MAPAAGLQTWARDAKQRRPYAAGRDHSLTHLLTSLLTYGFVRCLSQSTRNVDALAVRRGGGTRNPMDEAAHLNELNPKANLHIQWTETRRPRPVREWLRVAVFTKATVRTAVLGVIAPILCKHYEVTGHTFDPSLLTMLIATPAAFLIGAAFQRREKALQDLAEFRSVAVHLHRAFGLYGREETRAAGQRAVQVRFRCT